MVFIPWLTMVFFYKGRQVRCNLQVKLCDPHLGALSVNHYNKGASLYTSFSFTFNHLSLWAKLCSCAVGHYINYIEKLLTVYLKLYKPKL